MKDTESEIIYMMLAEIMLIFAFIFLLLPIINQFDDTHQNGEPDKNVLHLDVDVLRSTFSMSELEAVLPERWNEVTFVRMIEDIAARSGEQANILAIKDKENEYLKNEIKELKHNLKLPNTKKCMQELSSCKDLLTTAVKKSYPTEYQTVIDGALDNQSEYKNKILSLWDTAHGVRPCWVVEKDIASQQIQYPFTAELHDDHIILRKNWSTSRDNDALLLGFNKVINKNLSRSAFTSFGERILRISKQGGEGTDWAGLNKECRFFVKAQLKTKLNSSMQLLERYFYKLLIY